MGSKPITKKSVLAFLQGKPQGVTLSVCEYYFVAQKKNQTERIKEILDSLESKGQVMRVRRPSKTVEIIGAELAQMVGCAVEEAFVLVQGK